MNNQKAADKNNIDLLEQMNNDLDRFDYCPDEEDEEQSMMLTVNYMRELDS
jgi:hypothetical protein